jgi:ribose transport system permease protein
MSASQPLAEPAASAEPQSFLKRINVSWFYILAVFIALNVFFSLWHGNKYLDETNFRNIALNASQLMLLAIGATFVIISGGIDLSVSSVLVFSAVFGANAMVRFSGTHAEVRQYHHPTQNVGIPVGLAVAVLCGLAWGLFNGFAITKLKLPPFIVTLGSLGMALGLAQIYSGGSSVPYVPIAVQKEIGGRRLLGGHLPLLVLVAAIVVVWAAIALRMTRFGRYTFAIGSNSAAARRAGVNVDRHLIKVYAISGLLAGLAGAMDIARYATASSATHSADNLNAISAVVIGGTSLFGGLGSIVGTVIGAFIPAVLYNGLIIGGVDSFWQQPSMPHDSSAAGAISATGASTARFGSERSESFVTERSRRSLPESARSGRPSESISIH